MFIDHGAGVVIGEQAVIGYDVTIFHQVTLGAVGWWTDNQRPAGERRHPKVGDRVINRAATPSASGPGTLGRRRKRAQKEVGGDVPAGGPA